MAVSTDRRRAHVVLPDELLREIDTRVGQRRRSEFIQEAIEDTLSRLRRVEAFERAIATPTEGVSAWNTSESAAEWVRDLRQEWEERLQRVVPADTP